MLRGMQLPVLCILLLLWPQLLIPAASSSSLAHTHTASSRAAGERNSQPSSFAVQLPGQSETTARDIAARYGFKFIDKVNPLKGVYLFEEQLRNYVDVSVRGEVDQPHHHNSPSRKSHLERDPRVGFIIEQVPLPRVPRGYAPPTDPEWTNQWTLLNRGQVGLENIARDLNVEPVWMQGITGVNVTVAVVDDGVLYTNRDLKDNFVSSMSVDVASGDMDVLPEFNPRTSEIDHHGTSCAGVVAMAKDNGYCGVGVAYDVNLVGIRLLSSRGQTDLMEASALGHLQQDIDIYSNSWGPTDNGVLVDGPGPLTRAVMENGIKTGRRGLGSIYVWAVGNGRSQHDSCATDGYASSIYTIAVGSVDQWGQRAYYDEACSAKMAVTFNFNKISRSWIRAQVITTSVGSGCRDNFEGTSASCPMLAGILALALQANPTLSWRDVQYLVAFTSSREGVGYLNQWQRNGRGLWVSNEFGFGAVNGESLVTRARHWVSVPEQTFCTLRLNVIDEEIEAYPGAPILLPFNVSQASECVNISFVEHVVATISLELAGYNSTYSYSDYIRSQNLLSPHHSHVNISQLFGHSDVRRGDISISLVSPHGTKSQLLSRRRNDFVNVEGFDSWPFMSVLHWGESPFGEWMLNISYDPLKHHRGYASLKGFSLSLYGTTTVPESVRNIPPLCHRECYDTCAGEGKALCDRCILLRHSRTLDCVTTCPSDFYSRNGYCIDSSNETYTYIPTGKTYTSATGSVTDYDITSSLEKNPIPKNTSFSSCRCNSVLTSATITSAVLVVVLFLL